MNLVYLHEFLVLADSPSYSEAAERLYMSQSTLSKHIKALETELGVTLFERTTRSVYMTAQGEHLLPYARQITAMTYQYESELQNKAENILTIGSIPTMAQYNIIDLVLKFKEVHPEIMLRILEDDSLNLKKGLLNRKYDLAFIRDGNPPFSNKTDEDFLLEKEPYQRDNIVAVIPQGHELYGEAEITLPMLKNHRLCMLKEGTLIYEICTRACQAADFIPNIFFESHRIGNILQMCEKGKCIALLLDRHTNYPGVQRDIADGIYWIAKIVPSISTTVNLCHVKNEDPGPEARTFLNFVPEFMKELNK